MKLVELEVKVLARTQLDEEFSEQLWDKFGNVRQFTDGQAIALTAIRTCYSHLKPSEILLTEHDRYFMQDAIEEDGSKGEGTEADRLCRQIFNSKHTSTLEHVSFTFSIENLSRYSLAQLTRHRAGMSFSVQSQRYVKFGSENKSGGANYTAPESIRKNEEAMAIYQDAMEGIQDIYDDLRALGVPAEDARAVLVNGTATHLVFTANLTAILVFYSKRRKGAGAQLEISDLAEQIRLLVEEREPWTSYFFNK